MTTTSPSNTRDGAEDDRRASPLGAYITTVGALILLVSVWLDWVTLGPGDSEGNASSGYEADSVIPFMGYLALGFALALLYATVRADRRQHRGLSLASMAVGLASLLWTLSFMIDPISTVQYDENVSTEAGVYVGLLGALLWAVGSFLLAKEPEGDRESARIQTQTVTARPATTARVEHASDVRTTATTGVTDARAYDTDADHRVTGLQTHGDNDVDSGSTTYR